MARMRGRVALYAAVPMRRRSSRRSQLPGALPRAGGRRGCARGATRSCGSRRARRAWSSRTPREDDQHDLGWWSVLDMGRLDYRVATRGHPSRGMAYIRVPHDCYAIVRDRIVRDSIHPGADAQAGARLPRVRRLLQGQPRRARGGRHRALREGGARRARAPAVRAAARRRAGARPAPGQALQAPRRRQQVRHLRPPPRRVQHVPRGQRVLPVCRARRRWGSSTALRRSSGPRAAPPEGVGR